MLAVMLLLSGCAPSVAPLPQFTTQPISVRIIAGAGEAFGYFNGNWVRAPMYDYEFTVIQTTYAEGWESLKEIHRSHPEYDGRSGPRDETLYFRVRHSAHDGKGIPLMVESSLGRGEGHADSAFRNMVIEFKPDISRFAPFNTYRITQTIGELRISETVELFKSKDGGEIPFMKIVEKGLIYEPR